VHLREYVSCWGCVQVCLRFVRQTPCFLSVAQALVGLAKVFVLISVWTRRATQHAGLVCCMTL